jgi:hypothetical protein
MERMQNLGKCFEFHERCPNSLVGLLGVEDANGVLGFPIVFSFFHEGRLRGFLMGVDTFVLFSY